MVTIWLLIVIFTGGHKISDFLEEYIISAKIWQNGVLFNTIEYLFGVTSYKLAIIETRLLLREYEFA